MSRADAIFRTVGIPALNRFFGDSFSYTPPGQAVATPLTGIPALEWVPVGDPYSERMEERWTLEVAADAGIAIGGTVTRDAQTWTVAQVLTNDGLMMKFALRMAT